MRDQIRFELNMFPEVEWDRWVGKLTGECVFFGWLNRLNDAYKDFAVIVFESGEIKDVYCSSAKHSSLFANRLGLDHRDCKRVEDHFTNVWCVELKKNEWKK